MTINPNVKHYKVRYKKDEDIAKIILKFLACPILYIKEAAIFNTSKPMRPPLPGYIFSPDVYAASYKEDAAPEYGELNGKLAEHGYGFTCMGSTDKADKNRVCLMGMPRLKGLELPDDLRNLLMLNTYTSLPEEFVSNLIDYLEDV